MLIWFLLLGAIWSQKLEFERKKVFWRSGFDREHEVKNTDFVENHRSSEFKFIIKIFLHKKTVNFYRFFKYKSDTSVNLQVLN